MSQIVHISSLIVQTRPENMPRIRQYILDQGAEIPVEDSSGKLICLLETENEAEISSFANAIAVLDGVLSANLVYHVIDEPSDHMAVPIEAGAL